MGRVRVLYLPWTTQTRCGTVNTMFGLLLIILLVPQEARATYIDVGSGSYLLQLIIAWAALLFVAPKVPVKKFVPWLKSIRKRQPHE